MEEKVMNELMVQTRPDVLKGLLADKRSENTQRAYKKGLEVFFNSLGMASTPEIVNEFLRLPKKQATGMVLNFKAGLIEKGYSEQTINSRLAAIKSLVSYAGLVGSCEWDLGSVKAEKVKCYRDTRGESKEKILEMLRIPNRETVKGKRDFAILLLLWENALRRSEITQLNIGDFDPETREIKILGKGRGTQKEIILLSEHTAGAIKEWLSVRVDYQPSDPRFATGSKTGSSPVIGPGRLSTQRSPIYKSRLGALP
jgi:integrase/recombinase XerC